jgi:thiamine biosynthesis protein ThiS
VELDRRIVKQPRWGETVVTAGAEIEIVQFVGGG